MSGKAMNLSIVDISPQSARNLGEVKTGQIFSAPGASSFHEEGLFSPSTFGPVGSPARSTRFGRIELNAKLMQPIIYECVINLKSFYLSIMEGKATAEFDNKLKDFIPSTGPKSNTGYSFFLRHLPDIKFERTASEKRTEMILLVEKSIKENKCFIEHLLVMPAGLRDYTVSRTGKPEEDEINGFYRRILAQCSIIDPIRSKRTPEVYDGALIGIQKSIHLLKVYIDDLVGGKDKLILDKWLGRRTFTSTRNVISSYIDSSHELNDGRRAGYTDVVLGLNQFARALVPVSIHAVKNKYINGIFPSGNNSAYLTNVKTLKKEEILNSAMQKEYDLWTSPDGIEKVIAMLNNFHIRTYPVLLNKGKHYLGLLYRDNKVFKFFQDIDELPEGLDKNKVKPITLFDFLYISLYELDGKYPGLVTRYPIQDYGSISPLTIRLQPAVDTVQLTELNHLWEEDKSKVAVHFPLTNKNIIDTMMVPDAFLAHGYKGDFDGDAMSCTAVLSDEAINEIKNKHKSLNFYLNEQGDLWFSQSTDIIDSVFGNIT